MSGKYTPETLLPALRLLLRQETRLMPLASLITAALFIQWNASLMFFVSALNMGLPMSII